MSNILETYHLPSGQLLQIAQGDLTKEHVDGIVNPANSNLAHGGGVADAIVQTGGFIIQQESDLWIRQNGPVSHTEPAVTTAGRLPCRYVIHAVGPIWGEGEEDRKLTDAIQGSLVRAESLGLESIAIPAISTGIFGFPKERAARITIEALREFFQKYQSVKIKLVRLVLWDDETRNIFLNEAMRQFNHLTAE